MINEREGTSLISSYWALTLAIVPAMGYFYVFSYEKGYTSYFNIPVHYISLDLVTIITGTTYIIAAIFCILFALLIGYSIVLHFKPSLLDQFYQFGFIFTAGFIIMLLIHLYGRGFSVELLPFIFIIIANVLMYYVSPLFFAEFGSTRAERFKNYQKEYSILQFIGLENEKNLWLKNVTIGSFILVLFVSLPQLVGDNMGYRKACNDSEFLVMRSDNETMPEKVVLRIYDDRAILARFDRVTKVVYPEFTVVNILNTETTLHLEVVGPLIPLK